MEQSKEEKRGYRSIEEYEKKYFPRSLEKKRVLRTDDPNVFGVNLAKKSLDKIKQVLSQG